VSEDISADYRREIERLVHEAAGRGDVVIVGPPADLLRLGGRQVAVAPQVFLDRPLAGAGVVFAVQLPPADLVPAMPRGAPAAMNSSAMIRPFRMSGSAPKPPCWR